MARRTAYRIRSANGWFSVISTKHRGKDTCPGFAMRDDHLGWDFAAGAPDKPWRADITEHLTACSDPGVASELRAVTPPQGLTLI